MKEKDILRHKAVHRNGLLALSPLAVMALLFIALSFLMHGFHKVPLLVVFILTSVYGLSTLRGMSFEDRLSVFSEGAGNKNLLLMIWIFVLAGAFAAAAKAMGAVDATVAMTLGLVPSGMILSGLFVASCFISLSIGTSVGTVVALTPIASGLALQTGMELPLTVAAVVGGSFFGDNLSFISDTTVVATRTQGCRMSDKFRVNIRIALPAAVITFLLYAVLGSESSMPAATDNVAWWKIIPYLAVLVTAIMGLNVLWSLSLGILLCGAVGLCDSSYTAEGFLDAICTGIAGMSELILVSMMAGGLLAVIRKGGGITWIIHSLTQGVHSARGAEGCIAALVCLTNLCTANNTVAILSVGSISNDISRKFGVDPRKTASILDTFSCCIQGIIPYGAQLLMAGGLAAIPSTAIMPYLFYPLLLALCTLAAIIFRYPRLTTKP